MTRILVPDEESGIRSIIIIFFWAQRHTKMAYAVPSGTRTARSSWSRPAVTREDLNGTLNGSQLRTFSFIKEFILVPTWKTEPPLHVYKKRGGGGNVSTGVHDTHYLQGIPQEDDKRDVRGHASQEPAPARDSSARRWRRRGLSRVVAQEDIFKD